MVDLNPAAEYAATARKYMEDSSRELLSPDYRQASEKLWGAATQAIMAVAALRGWEYESHRAMQNAVKQLVQETGDHELTVGFQAAERLHINFYHGGLEFYQVSDFAVSVHRFVDGVLAMVDANGHGAPC